MTSSGMVNSNPGAALASSGENILLDDLQDMDVILFPSMEV